MSESGKGKRLGLVWRILAWFALVAVFAWISIVVSRSETANAYGFEGPFLRYGENAHLIYYSEGMDTELLMEFGASLLEAGYFSSEYGGVVQIHDEKDVFSVFLAYPKDYWKQEDFIEEMNVMAEDLETFVLHKPVSLLLVDADSSSIYRKRLH